MPLIAVAYAAFAAGLFLGYGGLSWLPTVTAIPAIFFAVLKRDAMIAGMVLFLLAGSSIASRSAPQKDRRSAPAAGVQSATLRAMKKRASKAIDEIFRADAPMAKALLIAEQQEIPLEMRDRYARAGMVHMLSISGLHVAIIAGAILLILQAAHVPRNSATLIGILLTAFYVALIGAPAPAVRSAGMLALGGASRLTGRPTSPWASLAVGAFVPLVNPRTVLDLGYQLSVLGIAGLIASGKLSRRLFEKREVRFRKIWKELLTSIVATIVTAPLVAWYFGRLSIIAPLANLASGPIVSVLQPTLFVALALAPFPMVARLFADAAHPLLLAFD
ncbi:MAG TPA: ComEC/Rec2 family competence protein, partial [Gemmatimonadaceae bacterium]